MRLALAGAVAIVVFATIGQLSHDGGVSAGGYGADVLPFLVAWVALALWTGRFVPTWLGAVTLGVIARMVILGHYRWSELAFWLVSLAFIGAAAFAASHVGGTSVTLPGERTGRGPQPPGFAPPTSPASSHFRDPSRGTREASGTPLRRRRGR